MKYGRALRRLPVIHLTEYRHGTDNSPDIIAQQGSRAVNLLAHLLYDDFPVLVFFSFRENLQDRCPGIVYLFDVPSLNQGRIYSEDLSTLGIDFRNDTIVVY